MPSAQKIYDEEGQIVGGPDNPLNVEGSITVIGTTKPTTFYTGQKDIPTNTDAVSLVASQTLLTVGRVEVTALPTNSENSLVYVGLTGFAAVNGHVLSPDKTTVIFIDDLAKVQVRTNTAGSDVSYSAS